MGTAPQRKPCTDPRGLTGVLIPAGNLMDRNLLKSLPTPSYLIDEKQLIANGKVLKNIQDRTGCRILLAQKAFSAYDCYPVMKPFLAGTEASGLFEARLGKTYWPEGECHVFCGAYRESEMPDILKYADHIVFNSPRQLEKYGALAKASGKSVGLRINPECSTQNHAIYDPCAPGSRLGTTRDQWHERMTPDLIDLLDGLHFHTLCEQHVEPFEQTYEAVKAKWKDVLPKMQWLNCGGGHYITHSDYDIPRLERLLLKIRQDFDLQVYLEPGEACVLNAGYLLTTVLDLPQNGETALCLVDCSGACHMPDVIEMPYRPPLLDAGQPGEKHFTYRIGSQTCLAGDVIGDYSFDEPLKEGSRLAFADMALYTMCKNNTFNGMPLPSIYVARANGTVELIRQFGYEDFRYRLGR